MSLSMAKADGVTVFTVTTNPTSACPPICQILGGLCYSPACCSVSQQLKKLQTKAQTILGTLHIMIGLLNIGLGIILFSSGGAPWFFRWNLCPYWLGSLFIFFGIMNIVSEKFPSPCLVIITAILNVAGVAFAISAIVVYSVTTADIYIWYMCRNDYYNNYYYDEYGQHRQTTTVSPSEALMKERCLEAKAVVLMLLRSISAVLIVLSVLELCVVISSAVLWIKSLCNTKKNVNKRDDDQEVYEPLTEDVSGKITV